MIFRGQALSGVKAQILALKKPVTIQPPNMQLFPLTVQQRPRTECGFKAAAIEITGEEVNDHSDENKDAVVKASSKVEEELNQSQ